MSDGAPHFLFRFSEGGIFGDGDQSITLTDTVSCSFADPASNLSQSACVLQVRIAATGFRFPSLIILIIIAGSPGAGLLQVDLLHGDALDGCLANAQCSG